jgi:hypothetical protein
MRNHSDRFICSQVVGESFQQVDVVPSLEKASELTNTDLILIPRTIKFDCSIPVWYSGVDMAGVRHDVCGELDSQRQIYPEYGLAHNHYRQRRFKQKQRSFKQTLSNIIR